MSFLGANFQSIAMEPFARIAGSAASIMSFVRVVVGTLLGIAIGQAFDGTSRPLLASMVIAGFGTLALVFWSERGELFTRRNAPK
jgi:DHA1 family bicyclomycin/chloramphenicol resistance-like MFS transporter